MSGEQQRTPSAPTRAGEKKRLKEFTPLQKFFVVGVAISTLGGTWFFVSGQAASTIDVTLSPTTVAETITTNPQLETGLVGHWTFDGEHMDWSSTTAEVRDRSGQGNNGDAQGGMSTRSVASGVLGQGLTFDGTDDVISIPYAPSLNGHTAMTVSAWIKTRTPSTTQHIVREPYGAYGLYLNANKFAFEMDASAYNYAEANIGGIQPNTWYHVVGVYQSGQQHKIYVNGVERTTYKDAATTGAIDNNGQPVGIGKSLDGTAYPFNGTIDDARIYNRALLADEISRLYGLGATTRVSETITTNPQLETGLVGHWTFDGMDMDWSSTTAEVRDRSGQGNKGDAQGGMSTRSVVPGVVGQGLTFDGSDDLLDLGNQSSLSFERTNPFSITAWIKRTDLTATNPVFSKEGAACGPGYGLAIDDAAGTVVSPNALHFYLENSGQTANIFAAAGNNPILTGEWRYVTATYDGSSNVSGVNLYIDGEKVTPTYTLNTLGTNSILTSGSARVGADCGGAARHFKGELDDVRVYNTVLSAEEVKRLYGLGH